MSLVLAIHEDTNANAALLRDGAILAAVAEERLTRKKYQPGFPEQAIATVLAQGQVTLDTIDAVVAGNRYHVVARLPLAEAAIEGEHDFFGLQHKAYLTLQARFARNGPLAWLAGGYDALALWQRFGKRVPLIDHHTAHAYSAYLGSGFDPALAVSIDNMGDGYSARVFRCAGNRCKPLWGSDAIASPGQFYGEIAQFLGFHILMAGKVTGLAAAGDPAPAYPVMQELFGLSKDRTAFTTYPLWRKHRERGPFAELSRFTREQVAAAAQKRLEDVIVEFVEHALDQTGASNLVLAGGVFANVLVNKKLWALPRIAGLFVQPAMSDQGIAAGAALAWQAEHGGVSAVPMDHAYYGPEFDEQAIGDALEASGLRYRRARDIDARVAKLLLQGKTVARYTGRMEYGPRALGHRSILFHTADATVNDWLNAKLQRSEFMPFAPATLAERASDCYRDYGPGVARTARFMNLAFDCKEAMKRTSPAVVHLDGTARPQVVHEDASPGLHRILSIVHQASGVPSVLNTSFNLHGEPIVNTPQQAIRSFRKARLDALAIGDFLVETES